MRIFSQALGMINITTALDWTALNSDSCYCSFVYVLKMAREWSLMTRSSAFEDIKINTEVRATAQAVSRLFPTAAARVRALFWLCWICGGQSGAWACFLRVLRILLPIFIPSIAPQSPSSILLGWYNKPVVAAVPSGPSLTPLRIIIKKVNTERELKTSWSIRIFQMRSFRIYMPHNRWKHYWVTHYFWSHIVKYTLLRNMFQIKVLCRNNFYNYAMYQIYVLRITQKKINKFISELRLDIILGLLLTIWSKVLFQKLIAGQLSKHCPLYENRKLTTVVTKTRHWSITWTV
jgi:hypothetical protein